MSLLLVGLDNPQSADPRHALFPRPKGCAGYRLWQMMRDVDDNFSELAYHRIHKLNLFPVGPAPKKMNVFHAYAGNVLRAQLAGRGVRVVLLGTVVRNSVLFNVNADSVRPMKFVELEGSHYAWIPHPSGRNHFYNDPNNRRAVGRWLLKEGLRE